MRTGLIARADNGGLGNLTWEFHRHMNPHKTLVVCEVSGRKDNLGRYPGAMTTTLPINEATIDAFLKDLDLVYTDETPYNFYLFKRAKELGVKTVLHYNYEFLEYFIDPTLPYPDLFLSPSSWYLPHVVDVFKEATKIAHLPIPVNRKVLPFKTHNKARIFVHIAGTKLHKDRNGTEIVLEALKYIKAKVRFKIYSQHDIGDIKYPNNVKLEVCVQDVDNYWDLYTEGDVLVMPRRYGGLCLPLNEAMSCGWIPLMPNCEPQSDFLLPDMLTPVNKIEKITLTPGEIDYNSVDPISLATHINLLAEMNKKQVEDLSNFSNTFSMVMSWDNLKPKYERLFEKLIRGEL